MAVPMVADIIILAENTAQVAAGKEDCTRAAAADKDAFLAEMRTNGTYKRQITDATKAQLIITPIYAAPAGT
jgi:hypothetical protein